MKRTILNRIFGGYLLIILSLSFFIIVISFVTIRSYYLDTFTEELKNIGVAIQSQVIEYVNRKDYKGLDRFVKNIGKNVNRRVTIINKEGVVLADSKKDPETMENHSTRPEVIQAYSGQVGKSIRFSTTVKEKMLYVALPLYIKGSIKGVIRVSLFLNNMNLFLKRLNFRIFQISIVFIVLSLLGALFFSRTIINPIKALVDASKKIASGEFDVRVFLKRDDELMELAKSFNLMAEKIKSLISSLESQKEELNNIISSIQEGLIMVDDDGKILLCNKSFKRYISEDVEGKELHSVLRIPEIGELLREIKNKQRGLSGEMEYKGRHFIVGGSYLKNNKIIFVFHDISEMKKLEKIKRDFAVNVSHELRTPLTAIKGYVETLEEEIDEKKKGYLNIIKRNTDRLINIVQDLLIISELENREIKPEMKVVNLKEIIENTLSIFGQKIEKKGLMIEKHIQEKLPSIKGDSFMLEQVFINLIDNAIKYTESGKIKISAKKEDNYIKIEVEDTGIGIPEKNLPRIFERFYVVDKSRSRKMGGTGLGLSIVKHVILLHNGRIDVESKVGKGTKFIIHLPIS